MSFLPNSSLWEGAPVSIIEVMPFEILYIATDVGGMDS